MFVQQMSDGQIIIHSDQVTSMTSDLWLGVLRVVDLGSVVPVLGLCCFWVRDGLGCEEVPVVFKTATLDLLVVDLHFVGVVGAEDQRVQVSELVILWGMRRVRVDHKCGRNERKVCGALGGGVPLFRIELRYPGEMECAKSCEVHCCSILWVIQGTPHTFSTSSISSAASE